MQEDMDAEEDEELVLDTPEPPADVPYADWEDFRAAALLSANGVALTESALVAALGGHQSVLQSAAAHTLGAGHHTAAIPALKELADRQEDLVRAEAAYALVRLGVPEARDMLEACLHLPIRGHLSPMVAAACLARLGDAIGFPVVVEGMGAARFGTRVIACKQLFFFVPFDGKDVSHGQPPDVYAQFERALADEDPDVQLIALVQLRELINPRTKRLVEGYASASQPPYLERLAREILDRPN